MTCGASFASHGGGKLGFDGIPSEPASAAKEYSLDVGPVPGAIGERLEHDEVLRRARVEAGVGKESERGGALDHALFERQGTERNVEGDASCRPEEKHPAGEGELDSVRNTSVERTRKRFDAARFAADAGQYREVDGSGETGLSPALHRDAADEAEFPVASPTERLELTREEEQSPHS